MFSMYKPLETGRLILRRWQAEDRDGFSGLNADPKVAEFLPNILSREESDAMADRIDAHFETHGYGLYAMQLKESGAFIGFTGLSHVGFEAPFTPAVEIGWRIAAAHWGKGYVPEAAGAVMRHAFEHLKMTRLVSFTVPDNRRSVRVMEKIGMVRVVEGDFAHPRLPADHRLSQHVLYKMDRASYMARAERGPGS